MTLQKQQSAAWISSRRGRHVLCAGLFGKQSGQRPPLAVACEEDGGASPNAEAGSAALFPPESRFANAAE